LISDRSPDDVLAWRPNGPVSVGLYLSQVRSLADRLPDSRWIVNLCEDRYHFAVLLGACALSGRVSLQPSSQSAQTLQQLQVAYPGAIAVTDDPGASVSPSVVPLLALDELPLHSETDVPLIPEDRTVAILFTSGSTGSPQPHAKTWGKLVANGQAEARALGLIGQSRVLVGTVPVQHSYGFESTFLLALHGGVPSGVASRSIRRIWRTPCPGSPRRGWW